MPKTKAPKRDRAGDNPVDNPVDKDGTESAPGQVNAPEPVDNNGDNPTAGEGAVEPLSTRILTVDPRDLVLLERNAHYMRPETYHRLVENIRRDGVLTSTPLVRPSAQGLVVLSGNHRVSASIDAGLATIEVMELLSDVTDARALAMQLSHNSLVGDDDPAMLAALYEEIDDVDWKAYAGLDDDTLGLLTQVDVGSICEANLDFATLTVMFLPGELERARAAAETAGALASADERWAARYADFGRLLDALDLVGRASGVKNHATALAVILDVFEAHCTDVADLFCDSDGHVDERAESRWVPLWAILGTDAVPAPVAALLRRAVDRMISAGDVSPKARWQAIEYLVAELAS